MPEVHIVGQIAGGWGFDEYDIYTKWRLVTGDRWRLLDGEISGRTWLAERKTHVDMAVWNEPIGASFACSTLQGWPKLLLQVHQADIHGRIDLAGYGLCTIPTAPGKHKREIAVWRPRGTEDEHFSAWLLGGNPRYVDPSVVLSTASRFGHATVSRGVVEVEINVVLKGFDGSVHFVPRAVEDAADSSNSACRECKTTEEAQRDAETRGKPQAPIKSAAFPASP